MLFALAGIYGLHNGASLYKEQLAEIQNIHEKIEKENQKQIAYFDEGKTGPEDRPWVDITNPFGAIWSNTIYHVKTPSPAIVYSIGQAEQYGFYKKLGFWASPYDPDMAEEIANPERLQTGTLDFAFVLLFLLPLLLLITLYNLKSAESEQGLLPLIKVQAGSSNAWLLSRTLFYGCLILVVNLLLILYGAMLTNVLASATQAFGQMVLFAVLYLSFWTIIFFFILKTGNSIVGNTLKMVGIWLLFTFLIPAAVHQWVSIKKPANLMTDLIDTIRDESGDIYDQPGDVTQSQLNTLFPEILNTSAAKDSTKMNEPFPRTALALVNELMKKKIAAIEADNQDKNKLIRSTYWFNPLTFLHNRLNHLSNTHYDDYQGYRDEVQALIDKQIKTFVLDSWNEVTVNKEKYLEYSKNLSSSLN